MLLVKKEENNNIVIEWLKIWISWDFTFFIGIFLKHAYPPKKIRSLRACKDPKLFLEEFNGIKKIPPLVAFIPETQKSNI